MAPETAGRSSVPALQLSTAHLLQYQACIVTSCKHSHMDSCKLVARASGTNRHDKLDPGTTRTAVRSDFQ